MQTHYGCGINDSIMEQLIMIDTAYRASAAATITAVCPLYGYGRQDRKTEGAVTARLIADLFKAAAPSGWCRSTSTAVGSRASSKDRSTT